MAIEVNVISEMYKYIYVKENEEQRWIRTKNNIAYLYILHLL